MMPLTPEREAQLEEYARRHGKDSAAALDEVLAEALEWELQDYDATVSAVREAYEDVKAGHTRPAAEFLENLRLKPARAWGASKTGQRSDYRPTLAKAANEVTLSSLR
jgi:hypothetical protein